MSIVVLLHFTHYVNCEFIESRTFPWLFTFIQGLTSAKINDHKLVHILCDFNLCDDMDKMMNIVHLDDTQAFEDNTNIWFWFHSLSVDSNTKQFSKKWVKLRKFIWNIFLFSRVLAQWIIITVIVIRNNWNFFQFHLSNGTHLLVFGCIWLIVWGNIIMKLLENILKDRYF